MFKREIVMIAAAAGFVLGAAVTAMYTGVRAKTVQESVQTANDSYFDRINIDVEDSNGGYYNILADVKLHCEQGSPVYLSVENPALLSFQISSKYHGGVWLFDNEEGSQLLSELKDLKEKFSQAGMDEESGRAERLIQQFDSAGPITGAIT